MIKHTAKDSAELCGPMEKHALGRVSTEKIGALAVDNQIDGWWVRSRRQKTIESQKIFCTIGYKTIVRMD